MRRYLLWVTDRQQVGAYRFVNRRFLLAVFVDRHELARFGPEPFGDPLTHARAAHGSQRALGDLDDKRFNIFEFLLGVHDSGLAERHIDAHAAIVDLFVDVVIGQFRVRQLTHGGARRTHGAHVLLAVRDHLGHQLGVRAERAVGLGDGELADQRRASVVLAHAGAERPAEILKATGQAVGPRLRGGAIELRQVEGHVEDMPENEPLKGGVVGADLALELGHALGERVRRQPRLHLVVVERIRHAEHLGAWIPRIVVYAAGPQAVAAARLEIKPQNHSLLARIADAQSKTATFRSYGFSRPSISWHNSAHASRSAAATRAAS